MEEKKYKVKILIDDRGSSLMRVRTKYEIIPSFPDQKFEEEWEKWEENDNGSVWIYKYDVIFSSNLPFKIKYRRWGWVGDYKIDEDKIIEAKEVNKNE